MEPGAFFTHLQSFPQLHLPPLSHPHVFSPQALQLMSFLLPVKTPALLLHAKPRPRRHEDGLALGHPACSSPRASQCSRNGSGPCPGFSPRGSDRAPGRAEVQPETRERCIAVGQHLHGIGRGQGNTGPQSEGMREMRRVHTRGLGSRRPRDHVAHQRPPEKMRQSDQGHEHQRNSDDQQAGRGPGDPPSKPAALRPHPAGRSRSSDCSRAPAHGRSQYPEPVLRNPRPWSSRLRRHRSRRCEAEPVGHFGSLSSRALMATITVLADISTAPSAGVSSTPHA